MSQIGTSSIELHRIAICDPVPMFRSGLRSVLSEAEFAVDEPEDIVDWANRGVGASVVLSLEDDDHWLTLEALRTSSAEVSVIALLTDPEPSLYRDALRSGARSAIARHAPGAELVNVVRAAINRQTVLPVAIVQALADWEDAQVPVELTDEEAGWLRELVNGVSVDDLAWRAGYSRRTMFRRLQTIYRRLGATRRDQALFEATRRGIV